MMRVVRILLFPFGWLYGQILSVRALLYAKGLFASHKVKVPVIAVGNLTLGGTGKTPMVEYLLEHLMDRYQVATLSRGYGRKTKGYLLASKEYNAEALGDEPFQFFLKYQDRISVCVGEQRVPAAEQLLLDRPDTNVIVLDDAFQHLAIRRDLNIMLCDHNRPFYLDYPLPAGRLREFPSAVDRADLIVVTKCPANISTQARKAMRDACARFSKAPLLFTTIEYGVPIAFGANKQVQDNVLVVSGIAQGAAYAQYVAGKYQMQQWIELGDHQEYTDAVIDRIVNTWQSMAMPDKVILTTEKDMARMRSARGWARLQNLPLFYIPIRMKVLEGEEKLKTMLEEVLRIA